MIFQILALCVGCFISGLLMGYFGGKADEKTKAHLDAEQEERDRERRRINAYKRK